MTYRTILTGATALSVLAVAGPAAAQVEIEFWHAMGGSLGEKVDEIAAGFNDSQSDYVVTPVYQGNYTETMTQAVAAFRTGNHPEIVQVFEVGTATMMSAAEGGAVYPVYQLMADVGADFDPDAYLPAVTGYYTDPDGNMLSMPFNSSTPVLYYNQDVFEAAGIDGPPETWPELAEDARAIIEGGHANCGFTVGWQSWVLLENFSAWHNLPIGSMANGFEGLGTEFEVNSPEHVQHIQSIADWQDEGIFEYGGRRSDSAPLFYSGECAMYINSSASYAGIVESTDFDFGVGMLPYWPDLADGPDGGPQNSIIGGATLWVLSGHEEDSYEAVAAFFNYLSSAEVQADWHQFTGYLPITSAAYELSQEQGFYDENPGTDTAIQQITLNEPTENSKGLRFGNFVQIRDIFNEELEAIWAGQKTAQEGLDAAVERGNELLRQFEQDNS